MQRLGTALPLLEFKRGAGNVTRAYALLIGRGDLKSKPARRAALWERKKEPRRGGSAGRGGARPEPETLQANLTPCRAHQLAAPGLRVWICRKA